MQTVILESHGWEFCTLALTPLKLSTVCSSWLHFGLTILTPCLVCQYVTAQGGDVTVSGPRLSAESQLTLHSGTPSVGPEQWPVCQVCAGCVCREPGDAGN